MLRFSMSVKVLMGPQIGPGHFAQASLTLLNGMH